MGFAQPREPLGQLGERRAAYQIEGQSRVLEYRCDPVRPLHAIVH
jgi:hypothetical protein